MGLLKDYVSFSDVRLIEMAVGSDPDAFEQLFMRYRNDILRFYLQKTHNNLPDSKDMLQETFVKVFVNLGKYDDQYSFGQWVHAIARNTFIDYTRKKRDNLLSIDRGEGRGYTVDIMSDAFSPEQHMIIDQSNRQFGLILDNLPPKYRTMIELRFFRELSYEEIAEEMDMPIGTVKTQIHRARARLNELIENDENV